MKSQKDFWDARHKKGAFEHFSKEASSFANEFAKIMPPSSRILELGCGVGVDSNYFASLGHTVIATDFSQSAIVKNVDYYHEKGLSFELLDLEEKFPYKDSSFDAVYARLSLHYFPDKKTREIFREILRVLKQDGLLGFVVKSVKDPNFGSGEELGENLFEKDGHVRHFFTEEYAKDVLESFEIVKIESRDEEFSGETSSFINVLARKK